ncbi:MAG: gamma-glutamylcyclotransferase family protein [Nocardioides sp.]|uniref:gamma-glutamylcyclotransferase family protein n=1 Tax=Nocardioides sp. TaxID=35761 RepID=UPI003266DCCE
MIQRLFVYGTLAPGAPNEHFLSGIEGWWEPATVRGSLVEEGWAVEHGYPAIALSDEAPEVDGLLFCSPLLDEEWARLDEFEGNGYERVTAQALRFDGQPVEAQVYVHRAG